MRIEPSKHDGREERKRKRKEREEKVKVKAKNIINNAIDIKLLLNITEIEYKQSVGRIMQTFEEEFKSASEYNIARRHFAGVINQGNVDGQWNLPVPEPIISIKRHAEFRSQRWQWNSNDHCRVYAHVKEALNTSILIDDTTDVDVLIGLLLFFAASIGGLSSKDKLQGLVTALAEDKPLSSEDDTGQVYINLRYKSYLRNKRQGDCEYTEGRWYMDALGLGLAEKILRSNDKETVLVSLQKDDRLINCINKSIKFCGVDDYKYKTLAAFCKVAPVILENTPEIECSELLFEYMVGRVKSVALNHAHYGSFISNPRKPDDVYDFIKFKNKSRSKSQGVRQYISTGEIYNSISRALTKKVKKLTKDELVKRLHELDKSKWPWFAILLVDFYLNKLETTAQEPSSIRTFHGTLSSLFLYNMDEIDNKSVVEDELLDHYEKLVDKKKTQNSKHQFWRLITHIQAFAESEDILPVIEDMPKFRKNGQFVRAGIISEQAFLILRQCIREMTGLDPASKQSLEMMVIMAYRTGMRIGELVKAKVKDIEISEEMWCLIRENEYGTNKSFSAKRKLPVKVLLCGNEKELFKQYLGQRRALCDGTNELLFSIDGASYIPWDSSEVSALISRMLRDITGNNDYTFHHLRHSAISRLHLIFEEEWSLVERLSSYSEMQAREIRDFILGKGTVKKEKYWELACLGGHESPDTTLRVYCHFCDLIISERIRRANFHFSITALRQLTSLTSNKLSRIVKSANATADKIPAVSVYPHISKLVDNYCKTEKTVSDAKIELEDEESIQSKGPSITVCHKLLSDLQKGLSVPVCVNKYGVDEAMIEKWRVNSLKIAKIETNSGKSRHVSVARQEKSKKVFLPAKPLRFEEQLEAGKIAQHLRTIFKDEKENIRVVIDYFLKNCTTSSSAIFFERKSILKKMIALLEGVIKKTRWKLIIKRPIWQSEDKVREYWSSTGIKDIEFNREFYKGKNNFTYGKAALHLKHPIEKKILEENQRFKKYTSSVMSYVFSMIAIMTFDKDMV